MTALWRMPIGEQVGEACQGAVIVSSASDKWCLS